VSKVAERVVFEDQDRGGCSPLANTKVY